MIETHLRPTAFVLAPTNHGTMIINRFDYREVGDGRAYGVGHQLLSSQSFDQPEVDAVLHILNARRQAHGDGLVALDCGANIGVHTIEWARHMHSWGEVISFEAQERVYYALAGNITVNNCFNAKAELAAVGGDVGSIMVPAPDYFSPSSFGSLELIESSKNEFIGQHVDYNEESMQKVKMVTIDSLSLPRLDLVKLDIEGMEEAALQGAKETIMNFKPIFVVEKIKSNQKNIIRFFKTRDYKVMDFGLNFLAMHETDPTLSAIEISPL